MNLKVPSVAPMHRSVFVLSDPDPDTHKESKVKLLTLVDAQVRLTLDKLLLLVL